MARRKLIPRRQLKNEQRSLTRSETAVSTSGRMKDRTGTSSIMSNNTSQHPSQNTSNAYYREFGREESQSAMAMFAKMSTTIANTLPEEEFGSQKNPNYRPNARYSSKVIFPVECKRDIFVESVTPMRNRKSRRGSGKHSVYQISVGREQSPYHEIRNVHMTSPSAGAILGASNTKSEIKDGSFKEDEEVEDTGCEDQPFDEKDDESLTLTYSSDEEKENEQVQQFINRNDKVMNGKTKLFVQTSNVFLDKRNHTNNGTWANKTRADIKGLNLANNKMGNTNCSTTIPTATRHLSVESGTNSAGTGGLRIETRTNVLNKLEEDNFRPSNRINTLQATAHAYGKSRLQPLHSDHLEANDNFSLHVRPTIQRSAMAAMEVSPSSTVSSLTLPAELENSTPREVFHSISLPRIIEDDVVIGEI